ncbi:MAG: RtcB family protein [Christensenellaceae bacterium]|nr:RtcB family protein [Christensenellaceae bacterium]
MFEINGKYNTAKVFANCADESAIAQVLLLCNQEFTSGSRIRLMPDIHAGAGCTIGTTMTITDKIVPNLVGVDIGCGMETVKLVEKDIDFRKLDMLIRERIPSGFDIRRTPHPYASEVDLNALNCRKHVNLNRAELSIGTLGGGNHFIEVDRDEEGSLYLVVHTGSRHLGKEAAEHYQNEGYRTLNSSSDADVEALIADLRAQGKQRQIESAVKQLRNTKRTSIPKELCYVEGAMFDNYIEDMRIIQRFAVLNRQAITDEILRGMKLHEADCFTTIHNYIDTERMILRKGAVSAKSGERLLIPINMQDGCLICIGKGNEDWNESAPHGAGRLMSRAEARNSFTVSEFARRMEGIYTTSVGKDTLDECPMAYKSIDSIVSNIGDTVSIERTIKPVYNFKAGDESRRGTSKSGKR